ncbi:hypothetical protein, partial [Gilvimarinus agarilyticus]|uniref:hypothetical protein n=1 Tax=Gilvimarinus agarilyticus TaxID=679259 RepID=UPI00059FF43B
HFVALDVADAPPFMWALCAMTNWEKVYMNAYFAFCVVFLVIYQLWFWPILNGTPEIVSISHDSMDIVVYTVLASSLFSEILLFRDLHLRKMNDKSGWVGALIMFNVVAAPLFYFKYARYPRSGLT